MELTLEQKGYVDLLARALQRFYEKDACDLFEINGDPQNGDSIGECAMVGCILRYVWCGRNCGGFDYLLPDVDVEYNKINSSESEWAQKTLVASADCGDGTTNECGKCGVCWRQIDKYKKELCKSKRHGACKRSACGKPPYKFRPDMIIHRRGESSYEDNGLVVEFKKDILGIDDEIAFDLAKIRYCTCKSAIFKYKIGAFVLLKKTQADVFIFDNQEVVDMFSVTGGCSRIELTVARIQYEPLKGLMEEVKQQS